jgi:MFS family permease
VRNYLRLLGNRPFAVLWGGSTLSAMGDAMTWVALVWIAFERGGAGMVSALVVVSTAPVIAGGFAMGLLLDRFDRRRVLVRVNLVLGLSVAAVPVWFAVAGPPPTWLLFVVAGLYGFLKMANWAGIPSLIPALVDDGDLTTANAMESASFGIADVAGPAIAGSLIALTGAVEVLAIDAVTYLAFLVCLVALRGRLPEAAPRRAGGGRTSLRPAFRFMWRTPAIRATTRMFMAFNVGEGMLLVLMPTFAREVIGGNAATFGALLSVFSLAALGGSVTVGAISWRWPLGRSIAVVQALAGSAFLGLAIATSLPAAALTLAIAGLLVPPLTIWAQTSRLRLTPEEMRGRVFGVLRTLMQSTPPAGGALAGVLLGGSSVVVPVLVMSGVMAVPGVIGVVTGALGDDGDPRPGSRDGSPDGRAHLPA